VYLAYGPSPLEAIGGNRTPFHTSVQPKALWAFCLTRKQSGRLSMLGQGLNLIALVLDVFSGILALKSTSKTGRPCMWGGGGGRRRWRTGEQSWRPIEKLSPCAHLNSKPKPAPSPPGRLPPHSLPNHIHPLC